MLPQVKTMSFSTWIPTNGYRYGTNVKIVAIATLVTCLQVIAAARET